MNILDIVFPKLCLRCTREGEYICESCRKKLVCPEAICPMCCRPSLDGWTHPRCRNREGMERLIVGLPYRGLVQKCLKKVKYQNQWDRVGFLFELWKDRVSSLALAELQPSDVVTSAPMWKGKEKDRGYNQAEILAKLIAKLYKVPYLIMLERVRETRPMFGLDKKERKDNVEKAFRLTPTIEPANIKRVMLVDDVWTTGATMKECVKVLKKAGDKEVWGVALAR